MPLNFNLPAKFGAAIFQPVRGINQKGKRMKKLRILHLEDSPADAMFVERTLKRNGFDAEISVARSAQDFLTAIDELRPDLILLDNGVPGFNGAAALDAARKRIPEVPSIIVSGSADERQIQDRLQAGAADYVLKDHLWQLPAAVKRAVPGSVVEKGVNERLERHNRGMMRLVTAVQELSLARTLDAVMAIVRRAARELTGADGASFVLRDGDKCHYADEDAVGPLWKGQRFPMSACVSGWTMMNRTPAIIEDIYVDPRIPAEAYRPTFVKSLVMVPIRTESPIGAIGNYWADRHLATPEEVELLQALANTTAVALESVQLYAELEQRVRDRTTELEIANRDLESFSYSVSHDLRAPLRSINGFIGLLAEEGHASLDDRAWHYIARARSETARMSRLIDDLLRLAKLSRVPLKLETVNLSRMAGEVLSHLRSLAPAREAEIKIEDDLEVRGDPGLMHVVMENLLSNAWKYSSKVPKARIEFGKTTNQDGGQVFFVQDNGAGFDMQYAGKLFTPFQRMHREEEFSGTGVGLATVQRILERHGGRIWADAVPGIGAVFRFTLPG
jgi:signal transduction histidine kinase/DNA-binding NarL/FixJ family response regulator